MKKLLPTTSNTLMKLVEPSVRDLLQQLEVKYVEYAKDFLRFKYNGCTCEIKVKVSAQAPCNCGRAKVEYAIAHGHSASIHTSHCQCHHYTTSEIK